MWDHLTHMDAYEAGNLTFDIASMFVGAGEVKALAKGGSFISKFNKVVKMDRLAAWADKGMDMARLADHGMDVVKLEKLGVKGETLTKLAKAAQADDVAAVEKIMGHLESNHPNLWQRAKITGRELKADFRKQLMLSNEALASKADQLLTRGDEFIRGAVDKVLDAQVIPTLVQDEFALAGAGGMLDGMNAGMRMERRPLRDSFSFMAREADDVERVGSTSTETLNLGSKVGSDESILVESYKKLRRNKEISGQAHHLNQDAAFREVIPKNEGLSIKLEGNIRKDIGSPHYNAHKSLEEFWDQYRKKGELYGTRPMMSDYNSALEKSLLDAGLSPTQAKQVISEAIRQQEFYGLMADDFVPRIPNRIYLPR